MAERRFLAPPLPPRERPLPLFPNEGGGGREGVRSKGGQDETPEARPGRWAVGLPGCWLVKSFRALGKTFSGPCWDSCGVKGWFMVPIAPLCVGFNGLENAVG